MASTRFRFEPREIHECVWNSFAWNSCTPNLIPGIKAKEEITLGLFCCVVDELFVSTPTEDVRKYDHLLAEYVGDHLGLHQALAMAGEIDPPARKVGRVFTNVGKILPIHQERYREYWDVAPKGLLCKIAFSKVYENLLEHVESKLLGMCRIGNMEFNPYATVAIEPRFLHNRKIVSLELVVGNDVRFQVFDNLFPTGRYSREHQGR